MTRVLLTKIDLDGVYVRGGQILGDAELVDGEWRALLRTWHGQLAVCVLKISEEESMTTPIMKYFEYQHLPARLQEVSKPLCEVAEKMNAELPDGPEKSAGLRKLLEAKDCFVRAQL